MYERCPLLKATFTIMAEEFYNILRYHYIGISTHFRGQTNEIVAENTRNRFDSHICQIDLRIIFIAKSL